jgi:hypothetical protein
MRFEFDTAENYAARGIVGAVGVTALTEAFFHVGGIWTALGGAALMISLGAHGHRQVQEPQSHTSE